jgi:purine-cytosine permease-like protein
MFGRAIKAVMENYGISGAITSEFLWGSLAMALGLFIAYKGPRWMVWAFNIATPAMLVLIAIITIRILTKYSLSDIAAVRPEGFSDSPYVSYVIAIEMAIGLGVSWLFQFAAYGRICKSEAGAFYGSFVGWGIMWALLAIPAMMVTLVTGEADIIDGLSSFGGGWMVVYLGLLCIANPSSLATNGYLVALTLRNFFPKVPWWAAVGVNFVVIGLVAVPAVYDRFGKFMVILATFTVCWATVWVMDVILRKFDVDLKGLYDETSKGPYYYYKGINLWTVVAVAAGTAVSLAIWTPWTFEIHLMGVFEVLGGSVPGAVVSGVVYYVLRRLFLVPKGIGLPQTTTAQEYAQFVAQTEPSQPVPQADTARQSAEG